MSVEQALEHPYFESLHEPAEELTCPNQFDFSFENGTHMVVWVRVRVWVWVRVGYWACVLLYGPGPNPKPNPNPNFNTNPHSNYHSKPYHFDADPNPS
jgi:hypothetical protein